MERSAELRAFLRSRRARLEPGDIGLDWEVLGRRTKGLRRQELALVAGISADYYARLEQGRARNVSDQVVDALARALRLDAVESEYLRRLVRPETPPGGPDGTRVVDPGLRSMIEALEPIPAMVHDFMMNVLAMNRMARVLLEGLANLPPARRNFARWLFLSAAARRCFLDWDTSARDTASTLRVAAAQPQNDAAQALIGELSVESAEFIAWWQRHEVTSPGAFGKRLHHPLVGELELRYQSLQVPQLTDRYVTLYTPQPGSSSADRLARLASLTARQPRS